MEQTRLALLQALLVRGLALVHVAPQLLEGLVHRVGAVGAALLALHHDQRDAVHEQHDVENDELLHPARRVDAELVDGEKAIILRIGEVDQLHHRILLATDLVHIHLRLEQQLLDRLVGLQQGAIGPTQDLVMQILQLLVSQPGLTLGGHVQRRDRSGKQLRQNPLAEVQAQALAWIGGNVRSLVDDLPAQSLQLLQEGLFYFRVLAHSPDSINSRSNCSMLGRLVCKFCGRASAS